MFAGITEVFKLRAIVAVLVFFGFSTFQSCQALRYTLFGKSVQAEVLKVDEIRKRRGYELVVTYRFTDDDGQSREEVDNAAAQLSNMSAQPSSDAEPWLTTVHYIPKAPGASRLPKPNDWIFIAFFGVMVAVVIGFGVWFWKDYSKHAAKMAATR